MVMIEKMEMQKTSNYTWKLFMNRIEKKWWRWGKRHEQVSQVQYTEQQLSFVDLLEVFRLFSSSRISTLTIYLCIEWTRFSIDVHRNWKIINITLCVFWRVHQHSSTSQKAFFIFIGLPIVDVWRWIFTWIYFQKGKEIFLV